MIRLFAIEWRRMWSRRLPWILVLLMTGAMLANGVITFLTSTSQPPDMSSFEAQIEQDVAQCREFAIREWTSYDDGTLGIQDQDYLNYLSQFESAEVYADENCNPDNFGYYVEDRRFCLVALYEPTVQYRQACPDIEMSEQGEYQEYRILVDGREYRSAHPTASGTIPTTSLVLLGIAAVLGATFIGAEYSAGTIETTLLWETRRRRVLGSKIAVAAVSAALIHIVVLGFLVAALMPSALWRGTSAGTDADFWLGLVGVILRGGVAAAAVAAMALSVSTLTRNTVGGVVALLGYLAVSPAIGASLARGLRSYDLTENLAVFVNGGEVGRYIRNEGGYFESVYHHGGNMALVIILAYAAVAIASGLVVFARRDID